MSCRLSLGRSRVQAVFSQKIHRYHCCNTGHVKRFLSSCPASWCPRYKKNWLNCDCVLIQKRTYIFFSAHKALKAWTNLYKSNLLYYFKLLKDEKLWNSQIYEHHKRRNDWTLGMEEIFSYKCKRIFIKRKQKTKIYSKFTWKHVNYISNFWVAL